ncbi:MAG: hypothetical protein ACQKBY_12700, partial [Verrucomicrobiales bacterium]
EVLNLTDSTTVLSETGLSHFQGGGAGSSITQVRLERGRSNADWIADNVIAEATPEPSAALLAGFALFPMLSRRRKG